MPSPQPSAVQLCTLMISHHLSFPRSYHEKAHIFMFLYTLVHVNKQFCSVAHEFTLPSQITIPLFIISKLPSFAFTHSQTSEPWFACSFSFPNNSNREESYPYLMVLHQAITSLLASTCAYNALTDFSEEGPFWRCTKDTLASGRYVYRVLSFNLAAAVDSTEARVQQQCFLHSLHCISRSTVVGTPHFFNPHLASSCLQGTVRWEWTEANFAIVISWSNLSTRFPSLRSRWVWGTCCSTVSDRTMWPR